MSHDAGLVQSGLSVDEHNVARPQMAVNDLGLEQGTLGWRIRLGPAAGLVARESNSRLGRSEQRLGQLLSAGRIVRMQVNEFAILVLYGISPRIDVRPIAN